MDKRLVKTDEELILLAHIANKQKEFLLAHPEFELSKKQLLTFKKLSAKLHKGTPLAYLLGYRWFYNRKFLVNNNVLIPRPETETLVDIAAEYVKNKRPKYVLDIGTGSGAIITTLSKNTKGKFFASDVSEKALQVAKANVKNNKAKVFLKKGSLFTPFKDLKQNLLIIANLPYLTKSQLKEKTIAKEPKLALYGGRNGLELIIKLMKQIHEAKVLHSALLLEMDPKQGNSIKKEAKKLWPQSKVLILKDLSGRSRFAFITF